MNEFCKVAGGEVDDQSSEPPSSSVTTQVDTPAKKHLFSAGFDDWKWQMTHRIRSVNDLTSFFPDLAAVGDLELVSKKYPMAITPYYGCLIRRLDTTDPIFAMSVPQLGELFDPACLKEDPLEENEDMPVPGLVHRYPDRALLIATTMCSMYCRHCTRKRIAGTREVSISQRRLAQVVEYLKMHPEVTDVIVSGGDPLTMSDSAIESVLSALRSVESVQVIRIGTRVPVVMPMRITEKLCSILKKYHPLWINTHFNHPAELTQYSAAACARLADAGIALGNQTVLLKGINDNPEIIEKLCRGLIQMRVRPYYMYQCDLVRGVEHFRTPLSRGIQIMEYLRGRLSGFAIPTFVVDAPHGGGKIPVLPTYIVSSSPTHTVLRNYEGMLISYPEPADPMIPGTGAPSMDSASNVWELACGKNSRIMPIKTIRGQRRQEQAVHKMNQGQME